MLQTSESYKVDRKSLKKIIQDPQLKQKVLLLQLNLKL